MANPFSVAPPSLQGLGQIGAAYFQNQEKQEQAAAQQAKQQEVQQLLERGDVSEMSQYMAANPQLAKGIESAFGFKSDVTKQNATETAFNILSGNDSDSAIRDRAALISREGGDPSGTLSLLEKTPDERARAARLTIANFGTPAQIKAVSDLTGGSEASMTPYQRERLKLDKRGQELREEEAKLRREDNVNKRKSLENRVKKETIQLDKLERELAADQKGGAAQKLLRDSSEGAKKASSFARRMIDSGTQLLELEDTIDPTSRVIGYISGGKGITSEAANRLATPEEQAYASAASDFVTAQLRDESGAAIGTEEFDRKYREFFPMPGDSPDQIALKRERRNFAAEDMRNLSGGLYDALYAEQESQAAQPEQQASQFTEGQTATNPQTGQTLVYRGGQWQAQ